VEDDEDVVVVGVELRALVARVDVLEVERVEVEMLLEPFAVRQARLFDVDPAEAARLGGFMMVVPGAILVGRSRARPSAGDPRG